MMLGILSAMRSPAFSPRFFKATAHFAVSSNNCLRETVKQSTGAPWPLFDDISQRSPSNMNAASAPCPARTCRSTSLNTAFVRAPVNQRQCGALSESKARSQGAKPSGKAGETGSPVLASHPDHAPFSPHMSQAPSAPTLDTNQYMVLEAISP